MINLRLVLHQHNIIHLTAVTKSIFKSLLAYIQHTVTLGKITKYFFYLIFKLKWFIQPLIYLVKKDIFLVSLYFDLRLYNIQRSHYQRIVDE